MTARASPRGRLWTGLAIAFAVAVAIRAIGLDYSLWNDEVASTMFAGTPVRLLWSDWMIHETNPPLYYTLLGGWEAVAGSGDVALRSLSVLIGGVGVALIFALGRRVGGWWTGVLAAALVCVSAQNILYSQQVRGYILAFTGATAAILAAVVFLDAVRAGHATGRRVALLALYVVATTVAVYSHTTLILLPALTGVFGLARLVLSRPARWRAGAEWIAAHVVVLLLWAWWAHITLIQAQVRATIGWIDTPSFPYAVRMTLESYLPWQIGPAQYLLALLAVAAAAHGAWQWRHRPDCLLLPFLACALPAMLYLLSLKVPMFLDRTVYWGSAPFLVTAAAGITALRWRALAAGGAVLLVVASLAGYLAWFPQREIEPWRGIVTAIARERPGATVLVDGKGPALAMERYCKAPTCTLHILGLASPSTDVWASGFAVPGMVGDEDAAAILRRRGSLVTVRWMAQDPLADPPADARSTMMALPSVHADNIGARAWRLR